MGKPAARLGDMHMCPMITPGLPPVPHVGGPITIGCPTVMICGQPAARLGDMCTCVGPPATIILGSVGVMIGGMPAARMGDMTAHGGMITIGAPTVLIGEVSPGVTVVKPTILAIVVMILKKELLKPLVQKANLIQSAIDGDSYAEES